MGTEVAASGLGKPGDGVLELALEDLPAPEALKLKGVVDLEATELGVRMSCATDFDPASFGSEKVPKLLSAEELAGAAMPRENMLDLGAVSVSALKLKFMLLQVIACHRV